MDFSDIGNRVALQPGNARSRAAPNLVDRNLRRLHSTSLAPLGNVRNPVVAHSDVIDVRASFVADPFMLQVDGTWHMFFEVLNAATGFGEIGMAVSDDARQWTIVKLY